MAHETTIYLASLRFDGERFAGHALDVDCVQELIAYRNIILECAKELWKRKHPDRVRLPKRFEEDFRLQFDRIDEGSAVVPLRRIVPTDQGELDLGTLDEFDEAAELVDAAISAANEDNLLPEALPANVVPLFREFGKTLRENEVLFTHARHSKADASYSAKARKRLSEWVGPAYEDVVDVVGEVSMANVRGTFSLTLQGSGSIVNGRFSAEQEVLVLDALRNHRTARLRVMGVGEFGTHDRSLNRFARIDDVQVAGANEVAFVEDAPPIWEQLAALGESAPAGTWDHVPADLSERIDDFVYRREQDPA
jgi:hypothetical protein